MPSTAPLLRLNKVSKRYDSPDGTGSLSVLREISLEIAARDSLAIVGPSGSGKSTLLQIMGTLDTPTSGTVTLSGEELGGLNDKQLALVRNHKIGFVFQAHYLLPQCTVAENVLVPTLADGNPPDRAEVEQRAERLLKRVGLEERMSHRPGQLSGGERQRVAVVRALINRPQLLLADEPTGSLDQDSAQRLCQLLLELNKEEEVALVIVTHARELAQRMDRVLALKEGHLTPQA